MHPEIAMTYHKLFETELGKKQVEHLPANWRRHISRIDSLPKPKKQLSPKQILELVSG